MTLCDIFVKKKSILN